MVSYLQWQASSGSIPFEVQQNVIRIDNIQSLELPL